MPERYGFVYVLRNQCMQAIYKIGMTMRPPSQRCAELSASTGVATPFEVVCFAESSDPYLLERRIHQSLSAFRVNQNREFFALCGGDLLNLFLILEEESPLVAYGDLSFMSELRAVPCTSKEGRFSELSIEASGYAAGGKCFPSNLRNVDSFGVAIGRSKEH